MERLLVALASELVAIIDGGVLGESMTVIVIDRTPDASGWLECRAQVQSTIVVHDGEVLHREILGESSSGIVLVHGAPGPAGLL